MIITSCITKMIDYSLEHHLRRAHLPPSQLSLCLLFRFVGSMWLCGSTWQTLFIITPPTELDLTESAVRGKGTGRNMYRKGRGRGGNPGRGGRGGRGKGGQGVWPPPPPVIDYKELVLPYLLSPMAPPRALLEVPLEFEDVAHFSRVIWENLLAEYEHVISEGPRGPALKAMPASDGKLNLVSFALFGFGVIR